MSSLTLMICHSVSCDRYEEMNLNRHPSSYFPLVNAHHSDTFKITLMAILAKICPSSNTWRLHFPFPTHFNPEDEAKESLRQPKTTNSVFTAVKTWNLV